MPNENCLEGMQCPKCGSEYPFRIRAVAWALGFDDGIEETHGHSWNCGSACLCGDCDYKATVSDFLIPEDRHA